MKPESKPDSGELRLMDCAFPVALLRARTATSRCFKPISDREGLSQEQYRVLRALAEDAPMDSRTLARRCVIMPPSVSRIVRNLELRGLIETLDSADRRHKPWQLTQAGHSLFCELAQESVQVYEQIEAAFGAAELETLVEQLNRLTQICDRFAASPKTDASSPKEPIRRQE